MLEGYTYQAGQLPEEHIPSGDQEKIVGALNSILGADGIMRLDFIDLDGVPPQTGHPPTEPGPAAGVRPPGGVMTCSTPELGPEARLEVAAFDEDAQCPRPLVGDWPVLAEEVRAGRRPPIPLVYFARHTLAWMSTDPAAASEEVSWAAGKRLSVEAATEFVQGWIAGDCGPTQPVASHHRGCAVRAMADRVGRLPRLAGRCSVCSVGAAVVRW